MFREIQPGEFSIFTMTQYYWENGFFFFFPAWKKNYLVSIRIAG